MREAFGRIAGRYDLLNHLLSFNLDRRWRRRTIERTAGIIERPGARILDGQFTAVQQAIGTQRRNGSGAAFLRDFVEEAKASGLVARLIAQHKVRGLSVAPAA